MRAEDVIWHGGGGPWWRRPKVGPPLCPFPEGPALESDRAGWALGSDDSVWSRQRDKGGPVAPVFQRSRCAVRMESGRERLPRESHQTLAPDQHLH